MPLEWTEADAERLRELERTTREYAAPGNTARMPSNLREERTLLEQKRQAFADSVANAPAEAAPEAEVAWDALLEEAPTDLMIEELKRRALAAGGTLPGVEAIQKPKRTAPKDEEKPKTAPKTEEKPKAESKAGKSPGKGKSNGDE